LDSKGSNYVRVGIFVLAGLITAAVLIFIIGDERNMFRRKVVLHTEFRNVAGLRVGSPVQMGGVNVGSVTAVRFSSNPRDPNLHVDFEMNHDALARVRRNSVAEIASKGLLGDKALEITVGDPAQPPVHDGATIPGREADEIGTALRNATTLLDRANTVMENIVTATRPFANEQLGHDVVALAHDLRLITNQVAAGNGTVGRLLRDPEMASRIDGTLASAQAAMREVQGATAQVHAIAREARSGRGLVHALVYDEQGGQAVRSMGQAASELAAITRDVRTGNGGLHNIIYGNDSAQVVANLNQTTAAVRDIMRDVQRGRGTLGALLVDPSLYEDLKSLVGNIQRNEILRAMVRYSIHASERGRQTTPQATPAGDPDPAPAPAPAQ
jgi:phospholipid/cholesterol/gamma-HCH transport system substrate-binding protein